MKFSPLLIVAAVPGGVFPSSFAPVFRSLPRASHGIIFILDNNFHDNFELRPVHPGHLQRPGLLRHWPSAGHCDVIIKDEKVAAIDITGSRNLTGICSLMRPDTLRRLH